MLHRDPRIGRDLPPYDMLRRSFHGWAATSCSGGGAPTGARHCYSVTVYLIHFFLEICHFFSRFNVLSLEYSAVFSDPNIHFRTEVTVRSYPKIVPTAYLKIGVSEA
jgi:hypothetical protein